MLATMETLTVAEKMIPFGSETRFPITCMLMLLAISRFHVILRKVDLAAEQNSIPEEF